MIHPARICVLRLTFAFPDADGDEVETSTICAGPSEQTALARFKRGRRKLAAHLKSYAVATRFREPPPPEAAPVGRPAQ